MKYTTTDLIKAIKRNASLPTSQIRFSASDFLKFLNEELELTIVGELLALKQDYFVTTHDQVLVANTSNYNMPTTAIGWKLESIGYVDSDGNYTRLPIITRDQRGSYESLSTTNVPSAVYIMGNSITTVPDVGTAVTGSLRYDFIRIQNELVSVESCGTISVVADTGTDYQMTVDSSPVATGALVDVISGTNPFNVIARSVTATVAGALVTVTYGTNFSRAPVAGDYVCVIGQTPIPNIPEDYHSVLAQAATLRCLIAMNDAKGIQTATMSLGNMFQKMKARSSRRVNDAPRKIVPNNYILNLMRKNS